MYKCRWRDAIPPLASNLADGNQVHEATHYKQELKWNAASGIFYFFFSFITIVSPLYEPVHHRSPIPVSTWSGASCGSNRWIWLIRHAIVVSRLRFLAPGGNASW